MLRRFARWLHLDVPAGRVEPGPVVEPDGTTNLPGVFVVGDLTGVPLLKFACDTGAAAAERVEGGTGEGDGLDLAILGGGVAGMAAALEAKKRGLRFVVLEASEPFSTIVNFPKKKPIYTYPAGMEPRGALQVSADVREDLIEELHEQVAAEDLPVRMGVTALGLRRDGDGYEVLVEDGEGVRARSVIVALGRSGNFRRLDVPGEDLDKVSNRLHDPAKFSGQRVLVVGGGDSALEAAVALDRAGAEVTLSYRGDSFTRPKPENVAALESGGTTVRFGSNVDEIREDAVVVDGDTLENDAVFALIGREPPLSFFRRSGIPILGEMTAGKWVALGAFFCACLAVYLWKAGYLAGGAGNPGFLYAAVYSLLIVVFGLRRIRRRPTPYIKRQTYTLMAFQVVPLFLLPTIILPWLDAIGWMPGWLEATFFPDKSWWRAYGFVLAWPLFFWNVMTEQPIWGWLVVSLVQTFVVIPWMVRRWGKGAYCGWVCSCGALAETLGDRHRHKMWHGPAANRWNLAGQVVLAFAFVALAWRVAGWALGDGNFFARSFAGVFAGPWKLGVDVFLAGAVGVGLYFWFSGRVWCRFFCPLAALMHVYAKFTRYRIFAERDKCISCNVCTTVCHQGIDVMNYANKGEAMTDVECVRCSACVTECPTGTLSFGVADDDGLPVALDRVAASPVQIREGDEPEDVLARLREQDRGHGI